MGTMIFTGKSNGNYTIDCSTDTDTDTDSDPLTCRAHRMGEELDKLTKGTEELVVKAVKDKEAEIMGM